MISAIFTDRPGAGASGRELVHTGKVWMGFNMRRGTARRTLIVTFVRKGEKVRLKCAEGTERVPKRKIKTKRQIE